MNSVELRSSKDFSDSRACRIGPTGSARGLLCCLLLLFLMSASPILWCQQGEVSDATSLAYVIPVDTEIYKGLIHPIERGIAEAESRNASVILFELNTPGGAVDTVLALKDLIIDASAVRGIHTASFVNREAYSAGALMALSTERIVMRPGSVIGAAAPILSTGQEMGETMEEKMVSALRSAFIAAAEVNDHSPTLAAAMVDRDEEIPGVIEKGKLLTLTEKEAVNLGLAEGRADTVEETLDLLGYPNAEIVRVKQTWAETIAMFITNPAIAGILLMIAIGGIYLEIRTPGFGVPGSLGILAFILVFWGHHIAGLAGYEVLLIFFAGIVLLSIELFVTPGFGVLGGLGILCIVGSMIFMLSERMPVFDPFFTMEDLARPVIVLAASIIGAAILSSIALLFLPKSNTFGQLFLAQTMGKDEGYVGTESKPVDMVGHEGITVGALRPAGIARFGKDRLDVVTQGDFIDAGRKVKIVKVQGRQIIVKEVKS